MNDPTKGTQGEKIRQWMEDGHHITPVSALSEFGCFRLAARISDLRNSGVDVRSEWAESINQFGETVRFKEYWIEDDFHLEAM